MQEELFVRNTPSNGVPVLKVNRKWDILQGIQLINLSLSKKIYLLTLSTWVMYILIVHTHNVIHNVYS